MVRADEPEVSTLSHFSRASLHSRTSVNNNKAVVSAPVARNEILVQRPILGTHQDVSTLAAEIPGLPRWNALHRDLPYRNGGSESGAIASPVASQQSLPTQEGVSRAEDRAIKSAADTQGREQLTHFPHASTNRAEGTAPSPLLPLASLGQRDRVARYEEISLSIASFQKQARNERYEIRSRRPRPSSADYERHRPNKSNKKKEKKERKEKRKKEKKEKKGKVKNEKKGKELDQDLLMLTTGHKKLTFWKQQAAKELKIGPEMKLISASVALFDRKSIRTVLPNRYLRMSTSSKKNHLRTIAFPGSVEMLLDSPITAVRNAYNEHTSDKLDTARLVLWTDGSAGGGMYGQSRGFAVTWRRSTATGWGRWEAAGYQGMFFDM
ncbi:hypothetical protein SLS60_002649 [Paraconiothyrium brasiliense]|uniref:Uncharacterized protein n=1 Tax=Paraconiothyrium brasiliense TaxID=300254 RepID=A0ABR3RTX3_9PLEO